MEPLKTLGIGVAVLGALLAFTAGFIWLMVNHIGVIIALCVLVISYILGEAFRGLNDETRTRLTSKS
jgi:hypothetical protein